MLTVLKNLKKELSVPADPYPDEAYKACHPDVQIPIDGIITSTETAVEALLAGTSLLGCRPIAGGRLQIGDVVCLRDATLYYLFLDYFRNLHLVRTEEVSGDIHEYAKEFFGSHDLVIADDSNAINIFRTHCPEDFQAIL